MPASGYSENLMMFGHALSECTENSESVSINYEVKMGIATPFAKLLVKARSEDTEFGDTVTIGRQSLSVPRRELRKMVAMLEQEIHYEPPNDGFADKFIETFLGGRSVEAIDYSDYQQADIIHDLNLPVPGELVNKYDALIDGGSLEHIFDVKQVLTNYMNLIKPGGNIFIYTTANNLCGHGFYQFSPELFYRVFEPENGFEVKTAVMVESPLLSVEMSRNSKLYCVKDPAEAGKRIQLVNRHPTMIFIHARKISSVIPFQSPPLQSDYRQTKWDKNRIDKTNHGFCCEDRPAFEYLSVWEETRRRIRQRRKNSHANKRFFQRIRL